MSGLPEADAALTAGVGDVTPTGGAAAAADADADADAWPLPLPLPCATGPIR
jgi:hypothetical protein